MRKPDRDFLELLAADWKAGLSLTQIGVKHGVTRNSVTGFANRNRDLFPKRGTASMTMAAGKASRTEQRRRDKQEARRKPVEAVEPTVKVVDDWSVTVSALTMTDPIPFVSRVNGQCGFPVEAADGRHGPQMPVCGAETRAGSYYCRFHRSVAYVPVKKRAAA